jgi:hypothetical protein
VADTDRQRPDNDDQKLEALISKALRITGHAEPSNADEIEALYDNIEPEAVPEDFITRIAEKASQDGEYIMTVNEDTIERLKSESDNDDDNVHSEFRAAARNAGTITDDIGELLDSDREKLDEDFRNKKYEDGD